MKVYYFNDESTDLIVRVQDMVNNTYGYILHPQRGQLFEFVAPDGSIPFIKKWNNSILLITYLPAESVAQFEKENV